MNIKSLFIYALSWSSAQAAGNYLPTNQFDICDKQVIEDALSHIDTTIFCETLTINQDEFLHANARSTGLEIVVNKDVTINGGINFSGAHGYSSGHSYDLPPPGGPGGRSGGGFGLYSGEPSNNSRLLNLEGAQGYVAYNQSYQVDCSSGAAGGSFAEASMPGISPVNCAAAAPNSGRAITIDDALSEEFRGGFGGGSAYSGDGGVADHYSLGGGGGGYIKIHAQGSITIGPSGMIRADGGYGGNAMFEEGAGGGGGSGGIIYLKSPIIKIDGYLSVVGGEGGSIYLNDEWIPSGGRGSRGFIVLERGDLREVLEHDSYYPQHHFPDYFDRNMLDSQIASCGAVASSKDNNNFALTIVGAFLITLMFGTSRKRALVQD